MISILLIEHSLPFYHVPTWEMLGSDPNIKLTIAYGTGFFTGGRHGVPSGEPPENSAVVYENCFLPRKFFKLSYLWHSEAIRLLKLNKYDVVIHQAELKIASLIYSMILAKRRGAKFCLWGIGDPLIKSRLLALYKRVIASYADAFIFYSQQNRQKYIEHGICKEKLFVAQNSVDVDLLLHYASTWNEHSIKVFKAEKNIDGFMVLTVGRLMERKRIDWLLEAVKQIHEKGKSIILVIIGDGTELSKLKNLANQMGIDHITIFAGQIIGSDKLAPYYLASDAIIAPAQVGHLATEAHAYGKPLILSNNRDCQGPESQILIPDSTGLLYKHGDTRDLAEKIMIIMDDPDRENKYKTACQDRAKTYAGTTTMVNGFIDAINFLTQSDLDRHKRIL